MHLSNGIHTQDLMKEPLYQRYVAPVIREIERHYDQNLTVQSLSRQVYITPQYLSRLFQKFLGCSTYEYLTTYRINQSKRIPDASSANGSTGNCRENRISGYQPFYCHVSQADRCDSSGISQNKLKKCDVQFFLIFVHHTLFYLFSYSSITASILLFTSAAISTVFISLYSSYSIGFKICTCTLIRSMDLVSKDL